MNLALVIYSLANGGAERAMSNLANALASRDHNVTVVTITGEAVPDFYTLRPDVVRIALDAASSSPHLVQAILNNWHRVLKLRTALRNINPDVIVSFLAKTNVVTVIAATGISAPVIVSERTSPIDHEMSRIWRALRDIAYSRAAICVTLTERTAQWFRERLPRANVRVIPNAVDTAIPEMPDATATITLNICGGRDFVLALGRLSPDKGYDMLLPAFAQAAKDHPMWRLVILGDGEERGRLELLTEQLGITSSVLMPGATRTPQFVLARAQMFALSSRYEGMPNALLEAMAQGLACVSFDCRTGPAELIDNEKSGLLIPPTNVEAFGSALGRLMDDAKLRGTLGEGALLASQRFSVPIIASAWESLFSDVLRKRSKADIDD